MSDYKTPNEKLISNEEAAELNACFKKKQIEVFGAESDKNFSCSSWYSIADLESYITYVKQQAAEKKIKVDGIRFYFGVYPENSKDTSKAGQNTMFMCPTQASTELSKEDDACNSKDIMEISAMNFGSTGNPPKNDYGK